MVVAEVAQPFNLLEPDVGGRRRRCLEPVGVGPRFGLLPGGAQEMDQVGQGMDVIWLQRQRAPGCRARLVRTSVGSVRQAEVVERRYEGRIFSQESFRRLASLSISALGQKRVDGPVLQGDVKGLVGRDVKISEQLGQSRL